MAPHPLLPRRAPKHITFTHAGTRPRRGRGGGARGARRRAAARGARGALYVRCRGLALYNTDYTRLRFINSILLYTLLAL